VSIKVPFLDLNAINLSYRVEFAEVLQKVLESGWVVLGEVVGKSDSR
jgi:hypothetical protein